MIVVSGGEAGLSDDGAQERVLETPAVLGPLAVWEGVQDEDAAEDGAGGEILERDDAVQGEENSCGDLDSSFDLI